MPRLSDPHFRDDDHAPDLITLQEAEEILSKKPRSKPMDWFFFFPTIGVIVACGIVAYLLSLTGREATPYVMVILVIMIAAPVGLWLGDLFRTINELRQSRETFYRNQAEREARRMEVVNRLIQHPLAWVKRQRTQYQFAIEGMSNRVSLLVGKPGTPPI